MAGVRWKRWRRNRTEMKKLFALCLAATALMGYCSVVTLADPPKDTKTAKKVVDVWHCPITGETVANKDDKGTVVGNYRAHFCCAGCPEQFAKLSKKEQKAKLKEAAKKDVETVKKG